MKFLEFYLQHIKDKNVFAIQEFSNGRYVDIHTIFGLTEEDEENPGDEQMFYLSGSNKNDESSFIHIDETVEIKDQIVYVTDMYGNKLELTFYRAQAIKFS